MSVRITLEKGTLFQGVLAIRRLSELDEEALMTDVAGLGESQTKRRISEGGPAPDGSSWKPNLAGTPTLNRTGDHLLTTIRAHASAREAEWGSWWPLAHVHQDGAVIVPKNAKALTFALPGNGFATVQKVTIPPRPFVGLSSDDAREIEDYVTDFLGALA